MGMLQRIIMDKFTMQEQEKLRIWKHRDQRCLPLVS